MKEIASHFSLPDKRSSAPTASAGRGKKVPASPTQRLWRGAWEPGPSLQLQGHRPLLWEGAAQSALPGAQGGRAHTPRAASRENRPARAESDRPGLGAPTHPQSIHPERGHASALPATPPLGGRLDRALTGRSPRPAASGHRCRPHKTARGGGRNAHEMGRRRAARVHACVDTPVGKRTPTPTHVHPRTHQPISLALPGTPGALPPEAQLPWSAEWTPPGAH